MFHKKYTLPALAALLMFQPLLVACQQPQSVKASETKLDAVLPTVEQVLDRYVQAIGGESAVQSRKSMVTKGVITIPALNATGTIDTYAKAPGKQLVGMASPALGSSRTGFNGTAGWTEEDGEIKDLPGYGKREADFYFQIKMKELFPKIDFKGKEKVNGRDAYLLEAPRNGNPKRWFFDSETGLLIRVEVHDAGGTLINSEDYEDFRVVDGVKVPFAIKRIQEGEIEVIIKMTEVKYDVAIDDAKFEKPGAKPAA